MLFYLPVSLIDVLYSEQNILCLLRRLCSNFNWIIQVWHLVFFINNFVVRSCALLLVFTYLSFMTVMRVGSVNSSLLISIFCCVYPSLCEFSILVFAAFCSSVGILVLISCTTLAASFICKPTYVGTRLPNVDWVVWENHVWFILVNDLAFRLVELSHLASYASILITLLLSRSIFDGN